ncbi:uncharacterized protein LOC132718738 isoform X2 [Ruditapes philippinarum]|uniref:uncharacterized protein LOC132718738 isoform X2 n=1 Tax=Ruditapes philippinarum TaxID=129788 RepID=UPI00295B6345|nr:uncharacterized protein LOC132718738 isoform X2 [Ruditapes philippinarum]
MNHLRKSHYMTDSALQLPPIVQILFVFQKSQYLQSSPPVNTRETGHSVMVNQNVLIPPNLLAEDVDDQIENDSALTETPFEPLRKASLKHLTWKTSFLIAVTSFRRCSDL